MTRTRLPIAFAIAALLCPGPLLRAQTHCAGDLDGSGAVTVDELVIGVSIALGLSPLTDGPLFDTDDSGDVTVDELVVAVNYALGGCPLSHTPTPTASTEPTPTSSATPPIIDFGLIAYVANDGSGTVSVINSARNSVAAQIAIGAGSAAAIVDDRCHDAAAKSLWLDGATAACRSARNTSPVRTGGLPRAIALSPSGDFAYVTSQFPDLVSVIDTATSRTVATIDGLGDSPEAIALTPDGRFAFVTSFAAASVAVIDTTIRAVVATVPVGPAPNAVAVTPDGDRAFVTHFNRSESGVPIEATVSVIDTTLARTDPQHAVISTLALGEESEAPTGIAIDLHGDFAYVAGYQFGKISVIDLRHGDALLTPIFVLDLLPEDESLPTAIAVAANGRVYVSNFASDSVIGILPATAPGGTAAASIDVVRGVGSFPASIAVTANGDRLVVGSFNPDAEFNATIPATNGNVAVIDAARKEVIANVGVDRFPVGIAIAPGAAPAGAHGGTSATIPTPNCYTIDCVNPSDCLVPLGRHQARLGGLRSGDGEHLCGGAGPKPTATPTLTPTLSPTPTPRDFLRGSGGYASANGKVYYPLGVSCTRDCTGNLFRIQITNLVISAGRLVKIQEFLIPPDTVLTSVVGDIDGQIPPLLHIKRTAILTGQLFAAEIDPIANGGDGRLELYYVDRGTDAVTFDGSGVPVYPITTADPSCPTGPQCVPAATVTEVFRVRRGTGGTSAIRVDTISFPNPPGPVVPSSGPICEGSGIACDPADPHTVNCGGGRCLLGGEASGQNVTLDDTVGTRLGNPASQGIIFDGFRLTGGLPDNNFGPASVIVIMVDASQSPGPLDFNAGGFKIDGEGVVSDAL